MLTIKENPWRFYIIFIIITWTIIIISIWNYMKYVFLFLQIAIHLYLIGLPSFLITLSRPSLTSCLKIVNWSFYHSPPVLWNNRPSHQRQVVHHATPPISNSPVSDLSTSVFLKKLKTHLFHSLVCIHLGYLRTDISRIDHASSFHLTHFAIIHRHIVHFWDRVHPWKN